eukprot:CAMPEP_0119279300 /NCGR_PEP_ID=MMETSP1329-20130426/20562_1 /TAXON_ID=114041 /ORGANISM="Genus nov. species nov., Strain RCC1024" /LENGTH=314 /DNA_ID=CAMNT_0007279837 /DNA_START=182 /DNA_END=1122 /DNA_ORIENTATION=+
MIFLLTASKALQRRGLRLAPRGRMPAASVDDVRCKPATTDELRRGISKDGFVSAKVADVTRAVAEMTRLQDCLPLAGTALGRAVASTVLVADGMDDEETFQIRFVGDGPLRGVFAVSNGRLETRGYVGNPRVDLSPSRGVAPGVGKGQLQVVRLKSLPGETELSTYNSVVEIQSGEIAEDVNHYVATSEQREGALSAGVSFGDHGVDAAAGWRVELLPGAPQEVCDHLIENIKKATLFSSTDLLKEGHTSETMLKVLLDGMEPNLDFEVKRPRFKCTCDVSRVYRTLALLPRPEIEDILRENGKIEARCEFCCR